MSNEETFWRDWLSGGEPQDHLDTDFSGLEAQRDATTGEWEVRDLLTNSTSIQTDVAATLCSHLVANSAIMGVASVDNFNHGRSVIYPKSKVRSTGTITEEGSAISEDDGAFGSPQLDASKQQPRYIGNRAPDVFLQTTY